ncbi:LytR family transcriptional regulator [Candidatus Saccharibacteria bacterium]|nr:LytR family transcriptional regulator [Candidatus Saccharibacteria bacterium]
MVKNNNSVDGFVRRRPQNTTHAKGVQHAGSRDLSADRPAQTTIHSGNPSHRPSRGQMHSGRHDDIQSALAELDKNANSVQQQDDKPSRKQKLFGKKNQASPVVGATDKKKSRKKLIKRLFIALIVLAILVGGYVGVRALIASGNVLEGNIFGAFQEEPLQQDENGRSNILIFGTAEDSEGGEHEGKYLTDSLMVLSVDQTKKNAFMVSVPRDLWVEYEEACTAGYEGKINAVFLCASNDGADETAGTEALKRKVGEVTGLDVQYHAHVNFSVVVNAVDAVGGVEVKVETDDPRGVLDRNFDWKCNYECYYVRYDQNEVAQMDGERALAFARARNASGGYGLSGGNFDREQNQQKVILALRDKALSAGTLTNVGKVTGLIDAMGDNLRTNFKTSEVRTLMKVAQSIDTANIQSVSLVNEESPVLTTAQYAGQSIVRPIDGLYSYASIARYINRTVNADAVTREAARVVVLNGSDVNGVAGDFAEELEGQGMSILGVDNAPDGNYGTYTVYKMMSERETPETLKRLQSRYKMNVVTNQDPPVVVSSDTEYVIVIGTAADAGTSAQ